MTYGIRSPSTRPAGRTTFGENPTVHSKGKRNAARDGFKPSDPRQPSQPAKIQREDIAPSLPQVSHTARAKHTVEIVGHAPNGSGRFNRPSYPNASRGAHGLDGQYDPKASTDDARGQAWAASANQGKQSSRRGAAKPETTTAH
jgi:hypothetical protein